VENAGEARRAGAGSRERRGAGRLGFTLIEILVVISIIAVLASLSAAYVLRARTRGKEGAVKARLSGLEVLIRQYETEIGDFPPSSLVQYGVAGNGLNDGIECLLACLDTRKRGGPFIRDLDPDQRANTDEDRLAPAEFAKVKKALDGARQDGVLWEYCDEWGNPLVYVHCRDYGKVFRIRRADGEIVEARAAKDPATGGYYKPTEFQLFSLGADEVCDGGEGDDVCHWMR
jgi:prepilin-type N-terminal cleavage/methylation domain-containing protein